MQSKRLSVSLVAVLTSFSLLTTNVFAVSRAPLPNKTVATSKTTAVNKTVAVTKTVALTQAGTLCDFVNPDQVNYDAQLVAVRSPLRVDTNETFRVKVFLKNTGNVPWFSGQTTCAGQVSLGTDESRDHDSLLYTKDLQGWEGSNRIAMDQMRVDPNAIASFTFLAQAGSNPDVYKEYFTPVVKDLQWIDNSKFFINVMVGDTGESASDIREKLSFSRTSGSVLGLDLNAPQTLKVTLKDQQLHVYLGDTDIRDFRVSTGKSDTPTPPGHYSIILKQEERTGFEPPHYVMPKFMMFQESGYGFHALPSLAHDGNTFWTEALTHIGVPVSHGCVRLLPEDAAWLFDFINVGAKVEISYS